MSTIESGAARTTKESIAAAARTLFEAGGYAATTVRAIASAAGVDPALVIRHFGSKDQLFVQVVAFDERIRPVFDGQVETLGNRLVEFVLAPEHAHFRTVLTTLMGASERTAIRTTLRETVRVVFVDELIAHIPAADAALRAELIAAQLGGLVSTWSVLEEPHPATHLRTQVVELYGKALQALIEG